MTCTRQTVSRATSIPGILCDRQNAKFCNMMDETKLKINIFFYRSFQNTGPGALFRIKSPSLPKANV